MAFPGAASVGASVGGTTVITIPGPADAGAFQIAIISITVNTETITPPSPDWTLRANITVQSASTPDRGNTQQVLIYEQGTPDTASAAFTKSGTRRFAAMRVSWPSVAAETWLSATPTSAGTGEINTATTSHTTPSITPPASTDVKVIAIGAVDSGPTPNNVTLALPGSPWVAVANVAEPATVGLAEVQLIGVVEQQVAGSASPTGVTATFTTSAVEEMALIPIVLHGTSSGTVVSAEPGRFFLSGL